MGRLLVLGPLQRFIFSKFKTGDDAPSIFSSCKYTKTLSFNAHTRNEAQQELGGRESSSVVFSTVNSLFFLPPSSEEEEEEEEEKLVLEEDELWRNSIEGVDMAQDLVKGLALSPSPRFFFRLGHSNSILDELCQQNDAQIAEAKAERGEAKEEEEETEEAGSCCSFAEDLGGNVKINECVFAVLKYSPNPYMDFSMSMQEMVRFHGEHCDWEFLRQMVLCFLRLNPISTHPFILRAFADLLLHILSESNSSDDDGNDIGCQNFQ